MRYDPLVLRLLTLVNVCCLICADCPNHGHELAIFFSIAVTELPKGVTGRRSKELGMIGDRLRR